MTSAIILAAGMGTRLGHDKPKALIDWGDGKIVDHQLRRLRDVGLADATIVIGFEARAVQDHVRRRWPGVRFVVNRDYRDTNTAKSLLLGLSACPKGGVLWMNGDVVFDGGIVQELLRNPERSAVAVDPRICGEEEVKYRVRDGRLVAISKQVHGDGEAVGINYVAPGDRALLEKALEYVEPDAYFERAVEHILPFTREPVHCVPIGEKRAIEIDFPEDLEAAHSLFEEDAREG